MVSQEISVYRGHEELLVTEHMLLDSSNFKGNNGNECKRGRTYAHGSSEKLYGMEPPFLVA